MAALAETPAPTKALLIGGNGSGKTGSLVSLAKAGYNLRIMDFEDGTEILFQLLKDDPEALKRVDVEKFSDEYSLTGLKRMVPQPKAFADSINCLANWPGLGSPKTWTNRDVLVIDTLTSQGRVAMNHVMGLKGKFTSVDPKDAHPSQPDWGDAMALQENLCAMLYSKSIVCHVLVLAHITFVQGEGDVQNKGYPSALGSKLPPKIGSYFNSTLLYDNEGVGNNKKRVIRTKSTSLVDTKTSAPGKVKDFYPIETGLADYFRDLHGPLKS